MQDIIDLLPKPLAAILGKFSPAEKGSIEEIRIRISRPLEIYLAGRPVFIDHIVTPEEGLQLLNRLSQHSIYTLEEELKRGYITIRGGHRVGIAGRVILEEGRVKGIRDVTFFNLRISRQKKGAASVLVDHLYKGGWNNTVIIGSPQTGKTTLLRDLARIISTGLPARGIASRKVGIVDERSEIAGSVKGIPQHDLGPRTDVLDACPKAEGMMMMIRSMSPDVLIVDEVGRKEDSDAIMEAVNAGVNLVITVHGTSVEDLYRRPTLRGILDMGVFTRFVVLNRTEGPGTISSVTDATGRNIFRKEGVTLA